MPSASVQERAPGASPARGDRVAELLPARVRPGPVGRVQEKWFRQGAGALGAGRVPGSQADHGLRGQLQLRVVREVKRDANGMELGVGKDMVVFDFDIRPDVRGGWG